MKLQVERLESRVVPSESPFPVVFKTTLGPRGRDYTIEVLRVDHTARLEIFKDGRTRHPLVKLDLPASTAPILREFVDAIMSVWGRPE